WLSVGVRFDSVVLIVTDQHDIGIGRLLEDRGLRTAEANGDVACKLRINSASEIVGLKRLGDGLPEGTSCIVDAAKLTLGQTQSLPGRFSVAVFPALGVERQIAGLGG